MHLGEKIKAIRELRGFTQGKLAKHSGLSKGYVSQLEKEEFNLGHQTVKALAEALLFPAHYFFQDDLWASKTPQFILAKAALDSFMAQHDDISSRDRMILSAALESAKSLYLEPAGWEQAYELLKVSQKFGPTIAELPRAADAEHAYGPTKKSTTSRRKKPVLR